MIIPAIDPDTLIELFAETTAWQAEVLRQAVNEATQQALQGRTLALANLHKTLTPGEPSPSDGAADVDAEALLRTVFSGVDAMLLQALQASRLIVQTFTGRGVALQTAWHGNPANGLRGPQAALNGCLALVSGVLDGIAEGLLPAAVTVPSRARRREG